MKYFSSALCGLILGLLFGYLAIFYSPLFAKEKQDHFISPLLLSPRPEVIGFMPYWLIGKADKDYSSQITTLTYFGLTVGKDGSIVKLANEQEEEPGWAAFTSSTLSKILNQSGKTGLKRSLLVFSSDSVAIDTLMSDPNEHARNLTHDVIPLMKEHGFTDLNLDIESTKNASVSAQDNFVTFIKEVRAQLTKEKIASLTVEISGNDVIKPYLIDAQKIAPYVDHIVFMAYDFHYIGSSVTGAVAPLFGAGITSEFDTQAAVEKLLAVMPSEKLILGIPLYGYEWETLASTPHAAIIPGTGITASNSRVQSFLSKCSTCSATFDDESKESYVIYNDKETSTFHQLFYPDEKATREKVSYAQTMHLGGLALWALGYEERTMMTPLETYIR
jgi:spore germination protein YaaH